MQFRPEHSGRTPQEFLLTYVIALMNEPYIQFKNISKSFGTYNVIDGLDLDIEQGEFLSLLGPSGSGKSTILMMLAGFEMPTSGSILAAGKQIKSLPPYKRDMGVVFQNYALFPHMTVAENVGFPLRMRGVNKTAIEKKTNTALETVQLSGTRSKYPAQLSGGQQQRVALARALIFEPTVVLMDEPLGALDKQLREQLQLDIRALHKRLGITIVFVTHDQTEALTMSDRIAVFNHGKIEQIGAPSEIYDRPKTKFVAEFIGDANLLEGEIVERGQSGATIKVSEGQVLRTVGFDGDGKVLVSIRPEHIRIGAGQAAANTVQMTIRDIIYAGDHLRVELSAAGFNLLANTRGGRGGWTVGQTVSVSFDADDCWVLRT